MTDNNDPKQRLLQLILEQGILHDRADHPLIARDGKTHLQWIMNFLGISLNHEALQLAAQQTLKLLNQFKGRQLATIGTAAVPLLSACILQSGGKYSGLMVRTKRKAYGTASLIDGRINQAESVIVVDDSIGSGNNMLDCIAKLEQAGLHVEGCVCLVRFGYDSGYAALVERGYRVLALFDQGRDISPHHPNDQHWPDNPVKDSFRQIVWDEQTLADYLSPFQAIHRSINHFWETGYLLKPPATFNQTLETSGGLWLSLRAQDHVYTSQGRQGFWQFPQDEVISAPLAVSYVSWLLARQLKDDPQRQQRLDNVALGLSLFGALEACAPGDFDPAKHALVVRSQEAPWKMGGALPNMPGFHSAAQLLWHARFNNTGLRRYEPYDLYRHSVRKLVEPGAEWPHGGASAPTQPWDENSAIIQPLAHQLSEWVQQVQRGEALPETTENLPESLFIPAQCQWLFLSVYTQGKQIACMGNVPQRLADLLELVKSAAQDERWQAQQQSDTPVYIRVAVLSQSQYLGYTQDLKTFNNFAPGHDAVAIQHKQQFALILPEVIAQYHWTLQQLNDALYQKAAIAQQDTPAHWRSYRCRSWQMDTAGRCHLLTPTQPLPPPSTLNAPPESLSAACLSFLNYHQNDSGWVNSHYNPDLHQVSQQDRVFNTAYVLWRLAGIDADALTANWQVSYQDIQQALLEDHADPANNALSTLERTMCLLALLASPQFRDKQRPLIAQQLLLTQQAFNRHGQLPKPETSLAMDCYGVELLALLTARQHGFLVDEALLRKAVQRFIDYSRYQATLRQYPILLQVLTFISHTFANNQPDTDIASQTADLITALANELWHWQQASGAFLPEQADLSPTLFTVQVLSALLTSGRPSPERFDKGFQYLRQQILLPEHAATVQSREYAVGGLYSGLTYSQMHMLSSAEMLWLLHQLPEQHS